MKISILLFLLFSHALSAQNFSRLDTIRGAYHEQRACFDLLHYHLQIRVDPQTRYISGNNRWTCRGISHSKSLQADLDPVFEIDSIQTSFGLAKYSRTGSSVKVQLPFFIEPELNFFIQIFYKGHPHAASNAPWEGGFVWEKDKEGFPWIGLACEGEGASLWMPSKDHPFDEPDSVYMEYEVPRGLMAVGNGQLIKKESPTDSTWRFHYAVRSPVNHYNISFNAGAFRSWEDTLSVPGLADPLKMSFFCLNSDFEKARNQWLQSRLILRTLSQIFGPYPFSRDGYKVVQTPFLGMEHQSCIAYGDQFKNNAFGFDFILMHETGHEWWGNRTSADDHADMWIHESFCTYSESLFLEKTQSQKQALNYLLGQKKKIKSKSPVLGKRDVYFNGWKDSDMYYKGAWMLHSFRYALGNDSLWFGILKDIGNRIGLKPISSDSFIHLLSQLTGRNAGPFFLSYLSQTDIPRLEYKKILLPDGKTNCMVKWARVLPGFKSDVPVRCNGKDYRISAGTDWEPLPFDIGTGNLEPVEDLFLYQIKLVL
jgi:aminopeptidase N